MHHEVIELESFGVARRAVETKPKDHQNDYTLIAFIKLSFKGKYQCLPVPAHLVRRRWSADERRVEYSSVSARSREAALTTNEEHCSLLSAYSFQRLSSRKRTLSAELDWQRSTAGSRHRLRLTNAERATIVHCGCTTFSSLKYAQVHFTVQFIQSRKHNETTKGRIKT